jgi:uncharacterized damage-inducible protein DinB
MNIIEASKHTLTELNDVLGQLDDATYGQPLAIFSNSSIGMHARHILEFYKCLFDQEDVINYDKRFRDLTLQSSLKYFSETVNDLISKLESIDNNLLSKEIILTSSEEGAEEVKSSLGRELQYNLEHTIHHSALLKIGILSLNKGVEIPITFGVAPSTLKYQRG